MEKNFEELKMEDIKINYRYQYEPEYLNLQKQFDSLILYFMEKADAKAMEKLLQIRNYKEKMEEITAINAIGQGFALGGKILYKIEKLKR